MCACVCVCVVMCRCERGHRTTKQASHKAGTAGWNQPPPPRHLQGHTFLLCVVPVGLSCWRDQLIADAAATMAHQPKAIQGQMAAAALELDAMTKSMAAHSKPHAKVCGLTWYLCLSVCLSVCLSLSLPVPPPQLHFTALPSTHAILCRVLCRIALYFAVLCCAVLCVMAAALTHSQATGSDGPRGGSNGAGGHQRCVLGKHAIVARDARAARRQRCSPAARCGPNFAAQCTTHSHSHSGCWGGRDCGAETTVGIVIIDQGEAKPASNTKAAAAAAAATAGSGTASCATDAAAAAAARRV